MKCVLCAMRPAMVPTRVRTLVSAEKPNLRRQTAGTPPVKRTEASELAASRMIGAAEPLGRMVLNLRDGAGSRWDEVGWTELKLGQYRDYLGSERGLNVSGRQLSDATHSFSLRAHRVKTTALSDRVGNSSSQKPDNPSSWPTRSIPLHPSVIPAPSRRLKPSVV